MTLTKISAEIPQEQETQVLQYVKAFESLLPFLIGLNSKERMRLAKLSRKRVDMVDRSFIHATSIPGYLPSFVTLEEFKKEVALRDCLQSIAKDLSYHYKWKTTSENNTDNPDNTENNDITDRTVK